jgi:hypothetical protein
VSDGGTDDGKAVRRWDSRPVRPVRPWRGTRARGEAGGEAGGTVRRSDGGSVLATDHADSAEGRILERVVRPWTMSLWPQNSPSAKSAAIRSCIWNLDLEL